MSEKIAQLAYISQCLAYNSRSLLGYLDHVTACADSQYSIFFQQVLSQTPATIISLEIIASIAAMVMATMKQVMLLSAPNLFPFFTSPSIPKLPNRSEKFPDIPEYDRDMKKLDAWEQ